MRGIDKHPDFIDWPGLTEPNWPPKQVSAKVPEDRKGWEQDIRKGGAKFDAGKLRWDLVPPEFERVVDVLTYGATKYADRNWEKGSSWCRFFAASMRHCWAWMRGENNDPETGLPHLAHAICCLMFVLAYQERGMVEYDDRPDTRDARKEPGEE